MKRVSIIWSILFLFSLLNIGGITAQERTASGITVSGTITDTDGLSMPGVVITVKKDNRVTASALSDIDGKYTIAATSESDSLSYSFVGYNLQSLRIGKNRVVNVIMSPNTLGLNEVVVTGYQTISKERVTGSFAKVTAETLEKQRLSNLEAILEGQVAGYANGQIRGTTSMKVSGKPLFVIDGFPIESNGYSSSTNSLVEVSPDLNLEDIESVTVLKDAAAASIYGARSANGVVVITTKKATKGKTNVSFSSTFTFSPYSFYTDNRTDAADMIAIEREWAASNPNLQGANAAAYAANLSKNAIYTSGGIMSILDYYTGKISSSELDNTLNNMASQGYRYYDDMEKYTKRNPFYQQYNLSVGKATDSNMFRTSITYKDNKFENTFDEDQTVGVNITNSLDITRWLKLDLGSFNFYQKSTNQTFNVLSPGYKYLPYDGLVNADGSHFTSTAASRMSQYNLGIMEQYGFYNMDITPLDEIGRNLRDTKSFSNRTSANLNVKFTDWLSFNAMFQYEYTSGRSTQLSSKDSYYVRSRVNNLASIDPANTNKAIFNLPYGNIYNIVNFDQNVYNYRQQLNFSKVFADKHEVTAIAGSETIHNKKELSSQTLYNYDTQMLTHTLINASSLASVQKIWGGSFSASDVFYQSEITNRFLSLYSNAAYTYDSKYNVTGSLRWDRSNLWGTGSKYQNKPIWSTGAAWNMDKESFFHVSWVDRLKVRASYGIAGNISTTNAPYLVAYYSNNNNVGGTQGGISKRPNPLLSWEKTTTANLGVDFSLFKNRFNGSLEFYNKIGVDLLSNTMGVPTEGFGYNTYEINNGEMRNRGIEVTLSGDIIRTKDFSWNATAIYAYNKNKVTYVNVTAPVYYLQLDYPQAYPRIGNAYTAIYGYKWAGLSEKGLPQVYNENGEKSITRPTSLDAIVYLGSTVPTHNGSFASNFHYKNFDLSFLFIYEAGHKMRNTNPAFLGTTYSSTMGNYITDISTTNKDIVNRWKQPGDEAHTNIPRIVFSESPDFLYDSYSVYTNSDLNVLDASNIRLRNVALSYNLPSFLCQKAFLRNARLQFNIENAFTIAASRDAKYMLNGYNSPNYVWALHLNF